MASRLSNARGTLELTQHQHIGVGLPHVLGAFAALDVDQRGVVVVVAAATAPSCADRPVPKRLASASLLHGQRRRRERIQKTTRRSCDRYLDFAKLSIFSISHSCLRSGLCKNMRCSTRCNCQTFLKAESTLRQKIDCPPQPGHHFRERLSSDTGGYEITRQSIWRQERPRDRDHANPGFHHR